MIHFTPCVVLYLAKINSLMIEMNSLLFYKATALNINSNKKRRETVGCILSLVILMFWLLVEDIFLT